MARKIHIPWDEERTFDIPDGTTVTVKCVKCEEGETQDGDPKIVLGFIVTAPQKYKGAKLTQGFTIPKGLRFLRPALRALMGEDPPKRASELDADSVEGRSCKAVVQINDDWTNLVEWEALGTVDDGIDDDLDSDSNEVRTVKVGKNTIELTEESLKKYKVSALHKIAKAAGVDPADVDDDKEALIDLILGRNDEDDDDDFDLDGLDDDLGDLDDVDDDFSLADEEEEEKPKRRRRRR